MEKIRVEYLTGIEEKTNNHTFLRHRPILEPNTKYRIETSKDHSSWIKRHQRKIKWGFVGALALVAGVVWYPLIKGEQNSPPTPPISGSPKPGTPDNPNESIFSSYTPTPDVSPTKVVPTNPAHSQFNR